MIKAAMWAVTIAVISLVAATLLAGVLRPGNLVFAALLAVSAALVCMLLTLIVEITPRTGAAGGLLTAVLYVALLAVTLWMAPLAPGAERPRVRLQDVAAVAGLAVACGAAGWLGTTRGLAL